MFAHKFRSNEALVDKESLFRFLQLCECGYRVKAGCDDSVIQTRFAGITPSEEFKAGAGGIVDGLTRKFCIGNKVAMVDVRGVLLGGGPDVVETCLHVKGDFYVGFVAGVIVVLKFGGKTLACAGFTNVSNAFAGIGDVYVLLASHDYGVLRPREAFPAATKATSRALELDPRLRREQALCALRDDRVVLDDQDPGAGHAAPPRRAGNQPARPHFLCG